MLLGRIEGMALDRSALTGAIVQQSTSHALIAIDSGGKILEWSKGSEHVLGWKEAEVLGKSWFLIFTDGDQEIGAPEQEMQMARDFGRSADNRLHVKQDGTVFWASGELLRVDSQPPGRMCFVKLLQDRTAEKQAITQQEFLLRELSHRIKNILTVVLSVSTYSFRSAKTLQDAKKTFTDRLFAISRAQDVLFEGNWAEADLAALVGRAAEVYVSTTDHIIELEGPQVRIGPKAALAFSVVLHELGTNALKYGALSGAGGRVKISWSITDDPKRMLRFNWLESGGPEVLRPHTTGFGTRLIESAFGPDAKVEMCFEPTGLQLYVGGPLSSFQGA